MTYEYVEIKMSHDQYHVIHEELPNSSQKEEVFCPEWGFYHYQRNNSSKKDAFNKLKEGMIEVRKSVIADMNEQIKRLEALEC
jgi:hypothetical protein